jgi:hypothetical protein
VKVTRALVVMALPLFAATVASADPPLDDEKRACFGAVEEGQRLRIAHKLAEAKEQLLRCSRPVCPALFRNDCAIWLAEVESAVPSVVFGARDSAGQDLVDVTVFVDGVRATDRLEGTSIDVDAGPHVFRFEWAGHAAVEQRAVIREGDKDRQITVTFTPRAPTETPARSAPFPVGVWVLGGVGVAGIVGFVGLFASTNSGVDQLRTQCAPNCSESAVDAQKVKLDLGYASLGVGIASLVAGATWFMRSRAVAPESPRVSLVPSPAPGGAKVSLAVRF